MSAPICICFWIYKNGSGLMLNLEGWLQVLTVKGSNYFDIALEEFCAC